MRASARRASALIVAAAAISAIVVGCTAAPEPPVATPSGAALTPSSSASASPEPEPVEPEVPPFDPAAEAEANLPVVEQALAPVASAGGIPAGRSVVEALTAAGIPLDAIQITPDRTAIGLPVDALLLSVRSGGSCVLGQFDGDALTTTTEPALASGACLLGATASLD
ncbi:hypothetical protein GCM10009792_05540 [Microcella alkalica]|uniref:DUF6993 domain-containing protein n=1 Tax=Microcella alkalica TaxID=355930 RepID=A0A839E5R5_9MICO|nr:hypothetical protein [Microcella alkalica]MBA8846676.1 hypothetical protein [Microcella alkalica]